MTQILGLITKVSRDPTALDILESLLRYFVQGTGRLDEQQARTILEVTTSLPDFRRLSFFVLGCAWLH
ncbi:hypothetical protein CKO42_21835 [Lamprobacter modestohalophilus]|uniref:Uncharacterized protein n=1 Tax=Lamprobacter modestohalophilus TaxID=1064514 RepID=A0A9X1B5Y2_9GAMM|nr:hypothetical protein [Lamprobacter modestohalophilus]MBK1621015.1 hypothetical protein [Lamprobacter modestohalophilus]